MDIRMSWYKVFANFQDAILCVLSRLPKLSCRVSCKVTQNRRQAASQTSHRCVSPSEVKIWKRASHSPAHSSCTGTW